MALYVGKVKYAVTKTRFRGFWAVVIHGFAGTTVTCGTSTRYIGSNESCTFRLTDAGVYTFVATRNGQTKTKVVKINDNTGYIVEFGLYIGMQQLEYIESTGTQWIDTGIIPDENTNVKVKASYVKIIPSSQYDSVVGSTVADGTANHRFYPLGYTYSTGKIRQSYGSVQYEQTFDTTIHTVDFNNADKQVVVDGTVVGSTASGFVKAETQSSLYLFATNVKRNLNSTPEWYGAVRLYSLQIYNNGTLVSDMIPVKDDTGHGALYDKVTQQIFYNSGTGDFVCGPNKPYTRIQYLESTGTQYIDTGFIADNNTRTQIKVLYNNNQNNHNGTVGAGRWSAGDGYRAYLWNTRFQCDYGNTYALGIVISNGDIVDIDFNKNIINYSVNNVSQTPLTLPSSIFTSPNTMEICKTSETNLGEIRVYFCKIWDNGELVRDMIPVLDLDDTPCMLDQVEGRLYYNKGTGNFIAGPEKE